MWSISVCGKDYQFKLTDFKIKKNGVILFKRLKLFHAYFAQIKGTFHTTMNRNKYIYGCFIDCTRQIVVLNVI